ncbi:AraC family transcriptional regulator [Vibrio marisflavi]|uniref:HTH-type transcriptional activator RhaR n=1 Tax=Vibrio marisflavi CECT 7928 TaxID=634439 RepID=A0ABN8DXB0_9VIBR|nr:GyrI-like domain-containing protein [Vibrio marisflavi]CAH0536049.1 HTH-type transcriptional activator RhaR [Vibrio marisflavi CECT 7928]
MNYEERVLATIDYIGKNLDDELPLEKLCQVACFSKFHFHRLFTAYTGLSLQQYIRWLRLKRAAHQLIIDDKVTILAVAIEAGFESHQAFTRVFKQACGLTPTQYRAVGNSAVWDSPPYKIPKLRENSMNVTIREEKSRRFAVLEHRGDPNTVGQSVNKLVNWAKSLPISVKPNAGDAFGYAYDDPATTKPEDFRFDLALTVPENLELKSEQITERRLPQGRYAVAVHCGSRDNIGETIYAVLRDWLPTSGEKLGELPCLFSYQNFDHEVAETELITECWFLLD